MNNMFLAPDRVTPPSTRMPAPGQAQPYYQGDPLPVMQTGTQPPATELVALNNSADSRSSTGKTLAWGAQGAPAQSPPAPVAAAPTAAWPPTPQPAAPISAANESPVAVPVDTDSLRFALPAPINPEPATPINAAPQGAPVAGQPVAVSPAAANQNVMLASYTAPSTNNLAPAAIPAATTPPPQPTSPWRTPQLSQPPANPMYGMQASPYHPVVAQPVTPPPNVVAQSQYATQPTNVMPVQLRAVPSPAQPGDPNPRIRIPGYDFPQTAAADGFRPRSTMR
jgi:hypothetical protein